MMFIILSSSDQLTDTHSKDTQLCAEWPGMHRPRICLEHQAGLCFQVKLKCCSNTF